MCKKLRVRDELMWIFSWTDFPLRIRDTRRADTWAENEPLRSFTFKTIKTQSITSCESIPLVEQPFHPKDHQLLLDTRH